MLDFFVRRAEHKGEFGRVALTSAEAESDWTGCPVTLNGLPGVLSRSAICLAAVTTELRFSCLFPAETNALCAPYVVASLEWSQTETQSLSK
jgi:hypothetical protein